MMIRTLDFTTELKPPKSSAYCDFYLTDEVIKTLKDILKSKIEELFNFDICQSSIFDFVKTKILTSCQENLCVEIYQHHFIFIADMIIVLIYRSFVLNLYELLLKFPDSHIFLKDFLFFILYMKDYMGEEVWYEIEDKLKADIQLKLLNIGNSTSFIIRGLVLIQRGLKIFDKQHLLIQSLSKLVCLYLKLRDDTVQCIIKALTIDSNDQEEDIFIEEFLALDEEANKDPLVVAKIKLDNLIDLDNLPEETEEMYKVAFDEWNPDPFVLSPIEFDPLTKKSSSVLSMLVQIYGSKELFVDEYRSLLASKLISSGGLVDQSNHERELVNYELLSLKFGEESMRKCEVMLNDNAETLAFNNNVCSKMSANFVPSVAIISKHFWPDIVGNNLKPCKEIEEVFHKVRNTFENDKAPKSLEFNFRTGFVELDVEYVKDSLVYQRVICASPLQAATLLFLQDNPLVKSQQISLAIDVEISQVDEAIKFWIAAGFCEIENSKIKLSEYPKDPKLDKSDGTHNFNQNNGQVNIKQKSFHVYTSYILGMLNNLGPLPLERIHNLLKIFVKGDEIYDETVEDLKEFLDELVSTDQLTFDSGKYLITT